MNWKVVIKWSLVLGLIVAAWQQVMGLTGWYADPVLTNVFYLVIPVDIVVVVLALRETRAELGYRRQVLSGLAVGVLGGVIVMGGAILFATVVAPDCFERLAQMQEQVLPQHGMPPEQVEAFVARTRACTPFQSALQGYAGTVVTSLVVALVAALFLRRRGRPSQFEDTLRA